MNRSERNWQVRLIGLALCLVTLLLYLQVLGHDFINFDDTGYVADNLSVQQGVNAETVLWAFTAGYESNWHPLTWISHMVDWQLYGLSHPGGHHLTNVLFHVANTLLLFLVLRRMTGAVWRSALVAALFGWHPLHVESVAWVSERKDVLSAFFGLLALGAYVRYAEQSKIKNPKSKISYALALLWFALGLMSKPMLVTLPFVLLLLDWWPLKRNAECPGASGRSAECVSERGQPCPQDSALASARTGLSAPRTATLLLEKLPFFALAGVSSVVTFAVQRHGGAMTLMEHLPFGWRLGNTLLSYGGYLQKMIWPSRLAIFYPFPDALPVWQCVAAAALLILILAGAIALRRTQPWLLMGWLWFLGMLVPVIGLVQVGGQAMADRYTYLPSVGVFIMLAWGGWSLLEKVPAGRTFAWAVTAPALAGCLVLTSLQLRYWENSVTLFRHALAVTTNNMVAHIDLGRALDDAGKSEQAQAEFQAALDIRPKSAAALTAMGLHCAKQGDAPDAARYFHLALASEPSFGDAHYNLGNLLAREGNLAEAAEQFAEVLRTSPDAADARNNLGAVLARLGRFDEAEAQFRKALELRPYFPEAEDQLAGVLQKKGRVTEALFHYTKAARLKPNFGHAQFRLGMLLAQQGDLSTAIPHLQAAARLEPANANYHYNLGAAYAAVGNWNLAAQSFSAAARLNPNDPDIQKRLAEAQAHLSGKTKQ